MKKLSLLIAVLSIVTFNACKKNNEVVITPPAPYKCVSCKTTPDALAANNASSKGIYKGVVIGSSGTIMFDIANNGTTITAVIVIDGVTVNLTSNVTWVAGQPYVAPFTGTLNGSPVTINFSVGLSGGTPTVTSSTIPGHPNTTLTVIKETSNDLVECFEGTYSTTLPETGTFNFILSRTAGIWGGISRKTGATTTSNVSGTISNNKLYVPGQTAPVGTLNSDQLSGTSQDSNNSTVTITGQRTL